MKPLILITTILSTIIPFSANANEILTDKNIRSFYNEAENIQTQGHKALVEFNKKHTHTDYIVVLSSQVVTKKGEIRNIKTEMDKEEFIALLKDSKKIYDILSFIDVEIISLDITADGTSAQVKNKTETVFTIQNTPPIKTISECDDHLIINPEGIIQFRDSICTQIPVSPPKK